VKKTNSLQRLILIVATTVGLPAGIARAQYTLTTLVSFNGTNGQYPEAGLTLSGNTLYGTTVNGGTGYDGQPKTGDGIVFSVPVTGGTPTVLVSFNGSNGANPVAGLIPSADGSTLYGTTFAGGAGWNPGSNDSGGGTVFSVPITGGTPTDLALLNFTTGIFPAAGLTLSGNTLYGTTTSGGGYMGGTVFSVPVTGGTPTVLASFNVLDEYQPMAGLTLSGDGNTLYGTTEEGGSHLSPGTVFSVPITGGTPTVLASLTPSTGSQPVGGLILSGDTLYGTTSFIGKVFSVPITGGTPTVLASLKGGSFAGLTLSGNTLYGTTSSGGAYGDGMVFSVPITGGTPTVLASFNGTNGEEPLAGLTLSGNTLYGATYEGGANGDGTVFALMLNAAWVSSSAPTAYGSPVGTLAISRVNGVYSIASADFTATSTGYLDVAGLDPTDTEVYALDIIDSVPANLASDLADAVSEIDAANYSGYSLTASTTDPTGEFGSGYNFYITVSGSTLETGSPYFGFDFTQLTGITDTLSVDAVAATGVPEPTTTSLLAASAGILLRRERRTTEIERSQSGSK
jgi:uncharacterized repeat protein (TIGR03803 family)